MKVDHIVKNSFPYQMKPKVLKKHPAVELGR